MTKTEIKIN